MEEIEPILRHYPPECRPTAVEPLGSAGGLSGARFWRLVAPRGALALRCWPIEHPMPDGLRFIHAVLRHAADRGMKILPVPIATADGHDTFVRHAGHLWELTPWLPGTADYERSPSAEKLRAAMQALAQFHISVSNFPLTPPLASSRGPAPAITHRLTRLDELQNGGIDKLTRAITRVPGVERQRAPSLFEPAGGSAQPRPQPSEHASLQNDLAPLARQIVAELPRIVPIAIARLAPLAKTPLPLQVCIRDVWHDHVLFNGYTVTGLIDFGASDIDTVATDVARLLRSLVGDDSPGWETGLTAYSTIRPLSESESQVVPALDTAGTILAAFNWIHWIYTEGREFGNQLQVNDRLTKLALRVRNVDVSVLEKRLQY